MSELLGLRGRLTAALVAVSALTLAVTALLVLVPLDRKLEQDAVISLAETARTARSTFEDLGSTKLRAGSPQQLSSLPNIANFTPASLNICAKERAIRWLRASNEPRQPTQ